LEELRYSGEVPRGTTWKKDEGGKICGMGTEDGLRENARTGSVGRKRGGEDARGGLEGGHKDIAKELGGEADTETR